MRHFENIVPDKTHTRYCKQSHLNEPKTRSPNILQLPEKQGN